MVITLVWGALVGGAILWIWGAFSWMVLPWHHATFRAFVDEAAVERTVLSAAPGSGVYGMPAPARHDKTMDKAAQAAADRAAQQRMTAGPIVTAIIQREGFGSVPLAMLRAFLIGALVSVLMTWLLLQTDGLSYWQKVGFVSGIGLAAGLICRLPDWNWHGYSTAFTAVQMCDHVAGAFLSGLALAALV